jgi:hypothetical protein
MYMVVRSIIDGKEDKEWRKVDGKDIWKIQYLSLKHCLHSRKIRLIESNAKYLMF